MGLSGCALSSAWSQPTVPSLITASTLCTSVLNLHRNKLLFELIVWPGRWCLMLTTPAPCQARMCEAGTAGPRGPAPQLLLPKMHPSLLASLF